MSIFQSQTLGVAAMDAMALTSDNMEMGRRVLLVEPNVDTEKLCRNVLERSGFLVDTVVSGLQAVVCARTRQPDLILMDVQLPDGPSHQAIEWLRANPALQSTPIVVLNGTSGDEAFSKGLAVTVIPRPLSAQSLQRAVRKVSTSNECPATK